MAKLPVENLNSKPIVKSDDEARERKYRAEEDLRTFQRAEEIRRDKSRTKDMKALAREQIKGLKKVTGK